LELGGDASFGGFTRRGKKRSAALPGAQSDQLAWSPHVSCDMRAVWVVSTDLRRVDELVWVKGQKPISAPGPACVAVHDGRQLALIGVRVPMAIDGPVLVHPGVWIDTTLAPLNTYG
jgi:hypothetical protein